ncbi:hypothetical protein CRG98_001698 [Punica granatum]|uniref:Uncharacterized protein n=1 Tax=Punica granatum TaxID=22663 RepID=A0A2I0LCH9_PUNGR|nr:hypothetical protein CRG98_001698 [Punica granatum]
MSQAGLFCSSTVSFGMKKIAKIVGLSNNGRWLFLGTKLDWRLLLRFVVLSLKVKGTQAGQRAANGGVTAKLQTQLMGENAVPGQRPKTLDSLFANLREQRHGGVAHMVERSLRMREAQGVGEDGPFVERWRWPRPDVQVYTLLIHGLAASLRVSDALRIIDGICKVGVSPGEEVPFGKVVRCPACMIAVAVAQPQDGVQIASCAKCRYKYELVSGDITNIESEEVSWGGDRHLTPPLPSRHRQPPDVMTLNLGSPCLSHFSQSHSPSLHLPRLLDAVLTSHSPSSSLSLRSYLALSAASSSFPHRASLSESKNGVADDPAPTPGPGVLTDKLLSEVAGAKDSDEVLRIIEEQSGRSSGVVSVPDCCSIIAASLDRNNAELALSVFYAMRASFVQGIRANMCHWLKAFRHRNSAPNYLY